jgi:hypothetical protein
LKKKNKLITYSMSLLAVRNQVLWRQATWSDRSGAEQKTHDAWVVRFIFSGSGGPSSRLHGGKLVLRVTLTNMEPRGIHSAAWA